jgi:hypothetical protein
VAVAAAALVVVLLSGRNVVRSTDNVVALGECQLH